MHRAILLVGLLVSAGLAGCAGTPPDVGPSKEVPPIERGSGRLEGSVVNDAFVGVPGATVRLLGSADTRRTDLDGKFVFAALPPGAHRLRVEAPGWIPAEVTANLEPDAMTQLTIFVEPVVLDEPYSTMQQIRGKLNCIAVRVVSTTTEGMACDTYRKDLGFPEDWAGTVTEVTWSKGATSTPYSRVSMLSKNASSSPAYARQIAESPAKIVLRPSTMHSQYQADAATPPKLEPAPLFAELMKSPVQLGGADVRVGLTVQQDFEIFHTTFYVETPATLDDYSALPR